VRERFGLLALEATWAHTPGQDDRSELGVAGDGTGRTNDRRIDGGDEGVSD
jgi:hypothetical protein